MDTTNTTDNTYINIPGSIGYTQRTIALDAVIRHQEGIIKSLSKQLADDEFGHYYNRRGLFGIFKLKKPTLTLVGHHFQQTIKQFERGLVSLQKELAGYVQVDINRNTGGQ